MRGLLFALLSLTPLCAFAQESRPVQCRFFCFAMAAAPSEVLALSDKGSEIRCPLPTSQISDKITCFATNQVISFVGATDKKPMVKASIPAAVSDALLIFVQSPPKAGEAAQWQILVIEDSAKNYPDGGAFVANFYSKDIRFIIGEHKGLLRAGGMHGYERPNQRDSFNMAPVVFEFQNKDKWHVANESALRFLPGMRYLIIAYVDPASGRPRIKTLQDMPPIKSSAKAPAPAP